MDNTAIKIYDIIDRMDKKHRKRLEKLFNSLDLELRRNLKKQKIPLKKQEGNGFIMSKELLIAQARFDEIFSVSSLSLFSRMNL